MIQLLFVLLAVVAAIGLFRCHDNDAPDPDKPAAQLEQLQQTPRKVEQDIGIQVDAINQRNQDTLNRY